MIQCENKNHLVHFAQVFISFQVFLFVFLAIHYNLEGPSGRSNSLRVSWRLFSGKKSAMLVFFQGNSGSGRGSRGILRLWCWLAEVPLVRITALPFVTARYRRGGGGLARQEMKGADGRRGYRKIWWRVAAWVGGNVVSSETDVEMEWDRRFEGK